MQIVQPIDWNDWVSASHVRNYVLGDPTLDFLAAYGTLRGYLQDTDPSFAYLRECDFSDFLMKKGQSFERGVVSQIKRILSEHSLEPIEQIAMEPQDMRDSACVARTLESMGEGTPVIYQGVLWDAKRKTYGSPDLLVRSDVLNLIIGDCIDAAEAHLPAPRLSAGNWHYRVVDIKFTTLHLNAQGEVGNEGSGKAYKAQIALYNAALEHAQGLIPPVAYLMGRGWEQSKDRGSSCLARMGRVSIDQPQFGANNPNIDWLKRAEEAVAWIRRLRTDGATWQCAPTPSVPELRPDMGNTLDSPWHQTKKKIAQSTGELTSLWQVGRDLRDAFILKYGIGDWRGDTFDVVKLMELDLSGQLWNKNRGCLANKGLRLRDIFEINRGGCADVVHPSTVPTAWNVWGSPGAIEFFVDFETVSDLDDDFSRLPEKNGQPLIFMIGCGHYEQNKWCFKAFTLEGLTLGSELQIINDWIDHMEAVRKRVAIDVAKPLIFHWSPAEVSVLETAYNSARKRHNDLPLAPNWFDFLNRVIKPSQLADCVVINGAMGFGLKAMGKALHQHGLIQTIWEDVPTDGLGAMTGAWWCYHEANDKGIPVKDVRTPDRDGSAGRYLMRDIEVYNQIDCQVMAEAIQYFRTPTTVQAAGDQMSAPA
jgi:hypothetical protein